MMKLDSTLIFSLLIPIWGLAVGLVTLKKHDARRALPFLVPAGVMLVFILAVGLSGLADKAEPFASEVAGAASASGSTASSPSTNASALNQLDPLAQELLAAANNVTRSSPRMIDANTRLDGAFAGPGATFTYLFTLPKVASYQLKPGYFNARVAPGIKKSVCASKQLRFFFNNHVVVTYKYRGNDGAQIGAVAMNSNTCADKRPLSQPEQASSPQTQQSEESSAPAAEHAPEQSSPEAQP